MYPRNAASPPRIAIGAVVQISDGAVQTSGCTVRVIEQGGVEGDGGGTTAYSTDGIVLYTPTQAETDQIAFIVIAKKTGCIPVSQTIITSASDVTGYAGIDWSKVNAPTTAVDLSGTNIKTNQKVDVETIKTQTVTCAAGVTVLASVGTAATSTAQTGDSYALANGANGFVAIKGDTAAILDDTGTSGVVVAPASKTGYSLGAGGAGSGAIAAAELNNIADAILDRNMATGTDSGTTTIRTVRQALRVMRNKVSISAGTATIYKEDDATSSWTAAVTTTAGDPISAVDPAGP